MSDLSADYFDAWYADMTRSARKDDLVQRHLGLPPELLSSSLLPWDGLGEVVDALGLGPGQVLLDLACGRGGYGLEAARRTGAQLVGVDFSAEAVRQAGELAARSGVPATYQVGDLAATGLPEGAVHAVMCVDAVQFAPEPAAAYAELRRVLASGGRVALTCWEARDRSCEDLPERMRAVDLGAGLSGAGFTQVQVVERPAWTAAEQGLWEEAAALDPGDDVALASLHEEAQRVRQSASLVRRVLATATAP